MKVVRQILDRKGNQIWKISPSATVYEALKLMSEKDVGALLVMEGTKVIGIISERDYARKIVLHGKFSKETLVKEIMSPRVLCVEVTQAIEECMALMIQKKVRHLPVLDGDNLAGIISIGDVVNALIDEKEFVIDQLVHYITGTP